MYPRVLARWRRSAIGMALLLLMLAKPAAAASVFEEIQVDREPGAMVVRIVFVAPLRYLSHTPAKRGNELRILLRALSANDFDSAALYGRETRGWEREQAGPLRSLSFEGSSTTGLQLTLSFELAVDFTVRSTPDLRTLVITIPGARAARTTAPSAPAPRAPAPRAPSAPPAREARVIQRRADVIYLASSLTPFNLGAIPRLPEFEGRKLFVTRAQVQGQEWYRLTLGYFDSPAEAKSLLRPLSDSYPGAWVGNTQVATTVEPVAPRVIKRTAPAGDRLSTMMQAGRDAMTTGEYANAVQLFTAILESPFNEYTQEAQELLGLARERNGQLAHAKAEYEEYLRHYPEGEDADRVRQRLAGVLTARPSEREMAAAEGADESKPESRKPAVWNWFGSLSQQYLRDETVVAENPADETINTSNLTTWFNLNGRRRGPDYDFRTQINLQHDHDLEAQTDPDSYSFSDLYAEFTKKSNRASLRFGRQRQNGSGTLGRFDGLTFSYPTSEMVTVNAVWGHPVNLNDKSSIQSDTSFLGVSADIVPGGSNWNYNAFLIQQEREGLLDRRAIGGEVRYFTADKSLFTVVDYDTSYSELNIFLTQGSWNLSDRTSIYASLDYRLSPLLTTGNALIGQTIGPVPVTTLSELQDSYSEEEIRQFALDRSAPTSTITLGGSHRVREDLQINADLSVTRTDATPASGTAPATEATATEYNYSLQFVASDFWTVGDTAIFGIRYGDTTTAKLLTFTTDVRRPLSSQWRLNSRLIVDYRDQTNTDPDVKTLTLKPSVRAEYRGWRSGQLEFEMGLNWVRKDDGTIVSDTTGYNFLMGYRWDF